MGQGRLRGYGTATLIALVVLAAGFAAPASADRPFGARFSDNLNGDIAQIGNTLLTCSEDQEGCQDVREGPPDPVDPDNNDFDMTHVDVDSDPSTFNSSRATLSLPTRRVRWAGLYWTGNRTAGVDGDAPPNVDARGTVLFTPPGGGTQTINAVQVDDLTSGDERVGNFYQAFADVTDLVRAAGSGEYTVANVQAGTGLNRHAGWSLVVVYRDGTQPPRNLTVFDGAQEVADGASTTIPVSGFQTPSSGPVRARVGIVAVEGDLGIDGDTLTLNGNVISDGLNPANNYLNSSITNEGARFSDKQPDYVNQLGFDVDRFSADGLLANGATSADIGLSTQGDRYSPQVVTFAIDLYYPNIQVEKTSEDVNGGDLLPGDELQYEVRVTNTGEDGAVDVVLEDEIPANTEYVAGSLRVVGDGPKTDAAGDDQAEFDAGRVTFRLGMGADATQGGAIGPGGEATARFRVRVADGTSDGTTITNVATVTGRAQTVGSAFSAEDDVSNTVVGAPPLQPDLVIDKRHTDDFQRGSEGVFELEVSNQGAGPTAGEVTVGDSLPVGLTPVRVEAGMWNCSIAGQDVSCSRSNPLEPGGNYRVIRIIVAVAEDAPDSLTNVARVDGGSDGNTTNNEDSDQVTIVDPPADPVDLAIDKSHTGDFQRGGQGQFTLTVTNVGPVASTGSVAVSDLLPAGLTPTSAAGPGWACRVTDQSVSCSRLDSLAPGGVYPITLNVTVAADAPASVTNVGEVSGGGDTNPANNQDSDDVTIVDPPPANADLRIVKTATEQAAVGGDVTYTLEVANAGPDAATGVVVRDAVPAEMALRGATASQGTCNAAGNEVTCQLGEMAPGGTAVVTISATVGPAAAGRTIPNTATTAGDGNDPDTSNNTSTDETVVAPQVDVAITKEAPAAASPGETISYALAVVNNGPSTASNVTVTDDLPEGVVFASADQPCGESSPGVVQCAVGTLAAGQGATFAIRVTVLGGAADSTLRNTAEVTQTESDTNPANNTDSADTAVGSLVDVAVVKNAPAEAVVGTPFSYSLEITNNGPSAATGVVVTDDLPDGIRLIQAVPQQGSCAEADGTVTCNLGGLASGTSTSVRLDVEALPQAANTTVENTATVTRTEPDSNPENDRSTVGTQVAPSVDVAIRKTADRDEVLVGDDVTYLLEVWNNGPNDATGVVVTDEIPAGMEFRSATDARCALAQRTLTCGLGNLAARDVALVEVVMRALPEAANTTVTNTAVVTRNEADSNPDNDRSSADTAVRPVADLSVEKTGDPDRVHVGEQVTYTLAVRNSGPNSATAVRVVDELPDGMAFVEATPSQGACDEADGTVTCELGEVAADAGAEVIVVARALVAAGGSEVTNVGTVSGPEHDPDTSNNRSETPTTVDELADLAIDKRAEVSSAQVGDQVPYVLTVTNAGPSTARSVVITDHLPEGARLISATPNRGTCSGDAPLRCEIGDLGVGEVGDVRVVIEVTAAGTAVNQAAVESPVDDPNPGDNQDQVETPVSQPPASPPPASPPAPTAPAEPSAPEESEPRRGLRPHLSQKRNRRLVRRGRTVLYTITYRNRGSRTASVRLCDRLPEHTTFVSATGRERLSRGRVCWRTVRVRPGRRIVRRIRLRIDRTAPRGRIRNLAVAYTRGARTLYDGVYVRPIGGSRTRRGGVTG